jgi:SSS family solute:Na+ symporter
MPPRLPLLDLIVISGYLLVMVGVGFWFARRSSNSNEFTSAGRSLPGWVVGLSIFGTFVSSISFLANPGKSYASDWNPFAFSLSLPIAAWVATRYFVPMYRGQGHISAYRHLEERFGSWARFYAGICFMLTQVARMATIMYLVALAVAPLTGWDVRWIIIGTGALVTLYTLLGGIEAVIWTDAIQSLVLTLGIVASIGLVCWQIPGGLWGTIQVSAEAGKFSLGSLSPSLTSSTFWMVMVYGLFINLQNFGIDQAYVQRYITAKSDAEAKKSVWMGALLYVPISALLFFVGTALFAFYQSMPERLPAGIAADQVFPHFIVHEFPDGLTGLLIASILAAAMSSVDSSLNSSATLVYEDWYKRLWRPAPSERQAMVVLYGATLVFGAVGTVAALAMLGAESALDIWWKMAGIFSGGMLGLFLLGILAPRANRRAALPATLVALLLIIWLSVSPTDLWPQAFSDFRNPLHSNLTIVLGTTLLLLIGLGLTLCLPSPSRTREPHA